MRAAGMHAGGMRSAALFSRPRGRFAPPRSGSDPPPASKPSGREGREAEWEAKEDHPLLRRERERHANGLVGPGEADYIGGREWRDMRERAPRMLPEEEIKEAVFPEDFYGTRLQRSVFPEDEGGRAYYEYDTLPPYEGDVLNRAEDAAQLLQTAEVEDAELDFWFRNPDMPDEGFPVTVETEKLKEYSPPAGTTESEPGSFTPHCPSLRGLPSAEQANLQPGAEVTGKVMGMHVRLGVLVDLGLDTAGLVPMWHDPGQRLDSRTFEELGAERFTETFRMESEVRVRVHALRFERLASGDTLFRFPIELELLEPHLGDTLRAPLPAEEGKASAPIALRDPFDLDAWRQAAQITGRQLPDSLLQADPEKLRREYEASHQEQVDNLRDTQIYDTQHDDRNARRGAPDPNWGAKDWPKGE